MCDKNHLVSFIREEDGAATVEFVVMTAAGVATAVALTDSVRETVSGLVDEVGIAASAVNTSTTFSDPSRQANDAFSGDGNS